MSDRAARIVLGVLAGLAVVLALGTDLPLASDGTFWSDAATYRTMADSLAHDLDLEYRSEDLARARSVYPGGPQGLFLKRVPAGDGGHRLVFGKALLYPLIGAPFVRLLGADRGLLLLNGLVLALALFLGFAERRRGSTPGAALAAVLAVYVLGVVPVYLLWLTPEILNVGLITGGLVAWRRGRTVLAALLIGLAAYSKYPNALIALPLVLDAFAASGSWARRTREAARRGALVVAVMAAGFGATWLATGELNYQGGERKTFYDRYPFDPGVTFDSAGVWMTTDHVGPLVAGRDGAEQTDRVAPPRTPEELRRSFLLNLGYFWIGRFGGALVYFPGVVLAALVFLLLGPRDRAGALALLALIASMLAYLLIIPDNWYGGGGAIGNRYFVNLVPLGLVLLPRGRGPGVALGAAVVTGLLLLPVLASPVHHSLNPGTHATRPAFRRLPAELTMLGDLSVFTEVWRRRRPYNAPGGDPARRPAGSPPSYFLWFLDDGTFGQETSFDEEGFWLRGGAAAEVVLQTLEPPAAIRLVVTAGPAGDIVTVRLGRDRHRLVLQPLRTREIVLKEPRPLLSYYGTDLYRLRLSSRYGSETEGDHRNLGSFVRIVLQRPAWSRTGLPFTGGTATTRRSARCGHWDSAAGRSRSSRHAGGQQSTRSSS
ncbi:MAG: hypothetical protein LJF15_16570 [Acidobacteria bacterium]|jgi:hypothetical protein|nr:hypothetical protein [Acidobacteriota bacterium]